MKITISLICLLMFLDSCGLNVFPLPQRSYSRIHNESGKDLVLTTYYSNNTIYETYAIAKGDSVEFDLEPMNRMEILYAPNDSVYVYYDDGKKLVFQRDEDSKKNFLLNYISETPKKGKYKDNPIDHYYITPSHYELAK